MKKLIFCFGILVMSKAGAQPMLQPVAARYLALGAYSKLYTDIYATRSNAAALAQLPTAAASIYAERRFGLADVSLYAASVGFKTAKGAFALHGNYYGFGLYNQNQFSLAYGLQISDKVDAGLQFNYHSVSQGNGYGNASSINASGGVILHLTPQFHAGINIYNPGGSNWGKNNLEKIPAQYTFGVGYDVSEKLYISAEAVKEENQEASVNAGLQYNVVEQVFIRLGISSAVSDVYASVGFKLKKCRVDVAASYHPQLGISPGILLLFNFGNKE